MALYGFINAATSLVHIVGILAIFGYGLIQARGQQRTALLLSGGLLLGSVVLGLLVSVVGSFIGLGGIQALGFIGRLMELAGLGVLVFAFVKQSAATNEPEGHQLAGPGYPASDPYPPRQNQQGSNPPRPWQQGQGPHPN